MKLHNIICHCVIFVWIILVNEALPLLLSSTHCQVPGFVYKLNCLHDVRYYAELPVNISAV